MRGEEETSIKPETLDSDEAHWVDCDAEDLGQRRF